MKKVIYVIERKWLPPAKGYREVLCGKLVLTKNDKTGDGNYRDIRENCYTVPEGNGHWGRRVSESFLRFL
ncbi:MAG: hypothetical protein AB7Y74_04495 [Syntrophorhabdus sp.]